MTKDFLTELDLELQNKEILPKTKEENSNSTEKKETKITWNTEKKVIKTENWKNNKKFDPVISKTTVLKFPETKFYLPTLREGYTRFIPIWWNNETWAKNMGMVQYDEDILLIDCWVQFPDQWMLWVNYSIPDVSFLTKYKKNIKAMLITHAHLDHIWALKHILPALGMPPIYWTRFTIWIIKKALEVVWVAASGTGYTIPAIATEIAPIAISQETLPVAFIFKTFFFKSPSISIESTSFFKASANSFSVFIAINFSCVL